MESAQDRPNAGSSARSLAGSPGWMRGWLFAAGLYNLAWGAFVVLLPDTLFRAVDMESLTGPGRGIWQCLGMVIGVYGIGYLCASRDPLRHWPIVLVGLLGKIFGPIGFVWTASRGEIPWSFGATILTNDLVWWVPFGLMLRAARKAEGTARPGGGGSRRIGGGSANAQGLPDGNRSIP